MPKIYKRNCNQCRTPYRGSGRLFCSNSCRTTWTNINDNVAWIPEVKAKISASRIGKPTTLGRKLPKSQKHKISTTLTGRKLSAAHRRAIGIGVKRSGVKPPRNPHLRGKNHPNWRGGHSPARAVDFSNPRYKEFRKGVLQRDKYTCQDCGQKGYKKGNRLEVHHVKPWGPYPNLRYEISNGLTLCFRCHNKTKRGTPRPATVDGYTIAQRLSKCAASL